MLCCQELPSGERLRFIGLIFPFFSTPSPFDAFNERGPIELSGSHLVWGKLKRLGYNPVKVAWWSTQSSGHDTSTWQTHRQPRHHSKCRADELRPAAKMVVSICNCVTLKSIAVEDTVCCKPTVYIRLHYISGAAKKIALWTFFTVSQMATLAWEFQCEILHAY